MEKPPENPESSRIRWLDPSGVRLFRDAAGHVRATVACLSTDGRGGRSVLRPSLHRAFPLGATDSYVELREEGGDAVGMLRGLSGLDAASRRLAQELLRERYVVAAIRAIKSLRHKMGMWFWEVDTDRGERTFAIKSLREDIRALGSGRVRVSDVHGNTYEIRDVEGLDARSRALFDRIA